MAVATGGVGVVEVAVLVVLVVLVVPVVSTVESSAPVALRASTSERPFSTSTVWVSVALSVAVSG